MKIPFDIKFRPQIESGEYKVETRDRRRVRIICWDKIDDNYPIIALVPFHGMEEPIIYTNNGQYIREGEMVEDDLFIITPEPELSEFEMKVSEFAETYEIAATDCKSEEYKICNGNLQLIIDKYASELFDLARKELEPEVLERLEIAYKNQDEVVYENGKRDGKAEALKDLPRWKTIKKDDNANVRIPHVGTNILGERMLYIGENAISIRRLTKLPGFKEDDNHE